MKAEVGNSDMTKNLYSRRQAWGIAEGNVFAYKHVVTRLGE
jgi:hypothetical protein